MAKPHHKPANVKLTGNSALRKPQALGGQYVKSGPKNWAKDDGLKAAGKALEASTKAPKVVALPPKGKAAKAAPVAPQAAPAPVTSDLSPAKKAWVTIRANLERDRAAAEKSGQPVPLTPAQKAWVTIRAKRAAALAAQGAVKRSPAAPVAPVVTVAKAPAKAAPVKTSAKAPAKSAKAKRRAA
jgi:hypothetical protein